jgi:hypothetical protein
VALWGTSRQELVVARDGSQQNLGIVAVQTSSGQKVRTNHLQTVAPRLVQTEHKSRGFDRLFDDWAALLTRIGQNS